MPNYQHSIFYNGNTQIKKAGVKQEYSTEELEEYIKCKDDILYFVKNYVKIISLDHGIVYFETWEFQEKMISTFDENRFSICMLPRQMGKTITVAAYLLHYAIFNSHKSIGILANRGATAREILSRMKRMLENLPFFLQPGVVKYNEGSITFGNDSTIMAEATSNDAIRGYSFNCIYLDEFAFVENADVFFTSTYPVISSGQDTKVIITSTPFGMNLFHKLWQEAKIKRNQFVPIEVHWSEHPNRDDAWMEQTIANIGQKQFDQEYGCSFFGTSGTLISGKFLSTMTWDEPTKKTDDFIYYVEPKEGHTYVITVDTAEGVEADYSVAHVTDITEKPYEQVCMFRSNTVVPIVFTEYIARLVKEYNNAYVLVETNSVGSQVGWYLYFEYEFENIIMTSVKQAENVVSGGFGSGGYDYGLRMTKRSKKTGCSNLKTLIQEGIYKIRDYETIAELQTFSKKRESYEAEEGKNDDIVMSLVVFAWLSTQPYFVDLVDQCVRHETVQQHTEEIDDAMAALFISDGGVELMNSMADDNVMVDNSMFG